MVLTTSVYKLEIDFKVFTVVYKKHRSTIFFHCIAIKETANDQLNVILGIINETTLFIENKLMPYLLLLLFSYREIRTALLEFNNFSPPTV